MCDQRLTNDIIQLQTGMRIPVEKLIESLTNFSDIFTHLCSLDPLGATEIMTSMIKIKSLLPAVAASNWQLQNITEQYQEATANAEREALQHQQKEQE